MILLLLTSVSLQEAIFNGMDNELTIKAIFGITSAFYFLKILGSDKVLRT